MNAYYQHEHISNTRQEELFSSTAGDRLIALICAVVAFFTNVITLRIMKALLCTVGFVGFFGVVGSMECESIGIFAGLLLCFAIAGGEFLLFKNMMKKK